MGSISNPGISNLAQILSNSGSALASAAVTSPTVQAALQNGPAGDLVQLSDQALQLQEAEGLFGAAAAPSTAGLFSSFSTPSLSSFSAPASNLDSLVSSLDTSLLASASSSAGALSANSTASSSNSNGSQQTGSNSSSSSSSPSDQLALYQADLLAQQTQALFGSGPAASTANTLNTLA